MLDRITRHDLSGYLIAALLGTTLLPCGLRENLRYAAVGYST